MAKYYIAWSEARTEGFITDDRKDASSARTGKKRRHNGYSSISTVAEAFHEAYSDDNMPPVETVEL